MTSSVLALKNGEVCSLSSGAFGGFFEERGLAYGDGFFDTMKYVRGAVPLWNLHRERMINACGRLGLFNQVYSQADFENIIDRSYTYILSSLSKASASKFSLGPESQLVVKFIVTRGELSIGSYAHPNAIPNVYAVVKKASSRSYLTNGTCIRISPLPIPKNPSLSGLKHLNRLNYILSSNCALESTESFFDKQIAFVIDDKHVVETMHHNIFCLSNNVLCTPCLEQAGVKGVMRRYILDWCRKQPLFDGVEERELSVDDLRTADEVFLTNAVDGYVPVTSIEIPRYFLEKVNPSGDAKMEYDAVVLPKTRKMDVISKLPDGFSV